MTERRVIISIVIGRSVRIAQATSSTTSILVLVAFNLVPLGGVLLGRWSVATLLVLYWVENGVVGVLNVAKILLAEGGAAGAAPTLGGNGAGVASRIGIAAFFLMHYGIFWLVHGVFVLTLPTLIGPNPAGRVPGAPSSVDWSSVAWGTLGLLISHGVSFVVNYLGQHEYRKVSPAEQMGRPYGRLVILHMAIILGALVSLTIGSPIGALLVLVVLKTAIDLALHVREHDALMGRPASG